jgi:hypothetical protein
MLNAIKRNVTVQRGGRIEVFVPELPDGTAAEVIVLETQRTSAGSAKRSLAGLIGRGKGAFASIEEVDRFIRDERDQWP